jgi:hypothetical protein
LQTEVQKSVDSPSVMRGRAGLRVAPLKLNSSGEVG